MLAVQDSCNATSTHQWLRERVDGHMRTELPEKSAITAGEVGVTCAADDHLRDRRVGMIVFNSCHADARVLRQADTLASRGAHVKIFAIANSSYPEGTETLPNGVQIQRVAVRSIFNLVFMWLAQLYHALRRTEVLRKRRETRIFHDHVMDLRTRRERREALERMAAHRRALRGVRIRVSRTGQRYRRALRGAYLFIHRRLARWLRPLHRPTQQVSFWKHVRAALEDWAPDVIHAHDANTLVPAGLASTSLGVPLVYDSHELWRHRNRGGRKAPLGRVADAAIETWGARRARAVITVSPGLVSWLERKYELSGRVHLLRNTPSRVPVTEAPSLRAMAGLGATERIILYTGRITTGRGIEEAIEAISELPDDVYLVMLGYGDPEYLADLVARARQYGMQHRFRYVGAVPHEQVPSTASQADVSIVAIQPTCLSYLHCLPNKLFEAIQAGLPVVASRLPDIQELLQEHEIGETFTVGDAKDMWRALSVALSDPDALKENVQRAADVLCWEVERERLLDVYNQVLTDETVELADDWETLFGSSAILEASEVPRHAAAA